MNLLKIDFLPTKYYEVDERIEQLSNKDKKLLLLRSGDVIKLLYFLKLKTEYINKQQFDSSDKLT